MENCNKNGIKRLGESCTLNNNCIYPNCLEKKEKKSYKTEVEAKEELERIINTTFKPWKKNHKKPSRIYLDPRDGLYYLTSKVQLKIY
jgi:hypothetical protein